MPLNIPFSVEGVDVDSFRRLGEVCRAQRALPTFDHGLLLQVAMADPADEAGLAAIRRATHQEVRPFGVVRADFDAVFDAITAPSAEEIAVAETASPGKRLPPAPPHAWRNLLPPAPARALAFELVAYAFEAGASDLLLDEQEHWMDVSIKRAGRRETLPPVDRDRSPALVRAFKEIAGLPTHTVLSWQTGAARFALAGGRWADLRIEITPTVHGESLVARIQDRDVQLARMAALPFRDPAQTAEVLGCLRQSQGLIIATGPTGHGKTTTLYACLGQLDRSRLNIRTLEDPVEFTIPWITQIPVGAGTGREFPQGLKSLLRQAPHVILLGELRDRAAAQTCLEAVDTGHLLFATLHTRDAVGVVSRLLDLGLTGRQIAAGLRLAIGQRLLRRLCPACRRAEALPPGAGERFAAHGLPAPLCLYAAPGCAACGFRGERGVIPVFELFRPGRSAAIEDAIAAADPVRYGERALRRLWLDAGGDPLARAALRLAAVGEVDYADAAALDG